MTGFVGGAITIFLELDEGFEAGARRQGHLPLYPLSFRQTFGLPFLTSV